MMQFLFGLYFSIFKKEYYKMNLGE